ncbi:MULTISPECIES: hypothetical protein [Photorhabdus]|uniref:Uncharacterized protein n=2 Tax=Photorhabdus TaxID=29487 RepID=A0A329VIM8_9GAMM|nr:MULTISPECIES: hypothetical protein [Photorhabdus]MDB6372621.1 hypothetical protein [Photorhabdus bodei]RAW92070.1 hypothetical protein CKY01_06020 [Photorhabdus laumondii subsp. clarkei]
MKSNWANERSAPLLFIFWGEFVAQNLEQQKIARQVQNQSALSALNCPIKDEIIATYDRAE